MAERTEIPLWQQQPVPVNAKAGGEETQIDEHVFNVREPALTPYLPERDRANGTAVVIFPGGGYERLAITKEGEEAAAWLNGLGVTAFVVKYRLKEFGHPAPLMDGLRAVQTVRRDAKRWHIDPQRIGVLGFSAGGHLASSVVTHFDDKRFLGEDRRTVSARPDFMILLYPVITFDDALTHPGSRRALLGEQPDAEWIKYYSNELHVTANTPPAFLVHSGNDQSVPVENSLLFYRGLRAAGVPVEMHLYQNAPHGFGLRPGHGAASAWPKLCEAWLLANGLLP